MKLCKLEKDGKSFMYVKMYMEMCEEDKIKELFSVENKLQIKEIEDHCKNNGISDVNREALIWINNWAEGYRIYLSSLKMVVFILKCAGRRAKDITWEEFCEIEDKVNNMHYFLNSIF